MMLSNLTFAAVVMAPPDPLGYPVPLVILQGLSYLTLTLHFVAMAFTLGSAFLLLWVKLKKGEHTETMEKYLSHALPLGFSYLVTLGIPPLLFLQVVYGQQFYASSVIIGGHWILVVPLLILAYGLFYLNKFAPGKWPRGQWALIGLALLSMLGIGFLYVNNITLSQTPERWLELYAANPGGGTLNRGEPTRFARLLLFTAPALCGAGLGLLFAGIYQARSGRGSAAAFKKLAWKACLLGLLLQLAGGAWLLASIPEAITAAFVAGPGKLFAFAGAGLAVLSVLAVFWAMGLKSYLGAVVAASVWTLSLASIVILRDMLRMEYLRPYFDPAAVPVNPQWGMFFMFVGTLVAGLGLIVVLTTVVVRNVSR